MTDENEIMNEQEDGGEQVREVRLLGESSELRERGVKHFGRSDGSYLAAAYGEAVHYEKDGAWADIDNRLQEAESEYTVPGREEPVREAVYRNTASSLLVELPRELTPESRFGLTEGKQSLRWGIALDDKPLAGKAEPVALPEDERPIMRAVAASKSALRYAEAAPGTELRYDLRGETLKESLVFAEAGCVPESVCYTVDAGELKAEAEKDGSVAFTDGEETAFTFRAPLFFDAAGAESLDLRVEVQPLPTGEVRLVYTPERGWLESTERVWPVTLDPVIVGRNTDGYCLCTHVCSNYPNNGYQNVLAKAAGHDSTRGNMRTFIRWTLPGLTRMDVVVNAMLTMTGLKEGAGATVYAHAATGSWSYSTLTWSNQPGHKTRVLDYQKVTASASQSYSWDVTSAAKQWYTGDLTNNGLVLIATNEDSAEENWAKLYSTEATLVITYRRPAGLEPYWSARELSADRAGTAYIGDYSGQVTLVKNDVSMAGTVCPVSVSHIYNTVYAGGQFCETGPGASMYARQKAGDGWKLDFQQTIVWLGNNYQMLYVDADGTPHGLLPTGSGSWQDEDGLGLTVTGSGSSFTVTDRQGNKLYFTNDHLSRTEDASGNRITYERDNNANPQVTRITRTPAGGSEATVATLSYNDSGFLSSITDAVGNTTSYTYNSAGRLTGVTHPDGTTASYTYDSNGRLLTAKDNETAYRLTFTYDAGGHVSSYKETAGSTTGVSVEVSGNVGVRSYRYCGPGRTLGDADDLITRYVFDNFGRTVCSSTSSVNGETIYSASASRYSVNSETDACNNRLQVGGTVGRRPITAAEADLFTKPNLLLNGNMATSTNWKDGSDASSPVSTYASGTATAPFARAVKIVGAADENHYATQEVSFTGDGIKATQTWLFSGWAKADSVALSGSGRSFQLRTRVIYTDGTSEVHTVSYCADSTAWQYAVLPIVPKQPDKYVRTLRASFGYCKNLRTAYFTYASLTEEPAQSYKYNDEGELVSVATPENNQESFTYDGADLITAVTKGAGTLSYEYDAHHRPTKATNDGVSMAISYDGAGNTTGTVLTGTGTSKKISSAATYDTAMRRVLTKTDARGKVTQYTYGTNMSKFQGTPTKVTDALGHSVTTSYNGQNGRVTGSALEDNSVKLAYTYGTDGRLSELKRTVGSAVQSYAMTYNPFGKLKTLHVGERLLLTNTYGANNGPLTKAQSGNGYYTRYSYDGLERLEKVYYNRTASGNPDVLYGYAGEGRLKSRTDTPADRVQTYTYDGLGRLLTLKEDTVGGQALVDATWTYDLANRPSTLKYKVSRLWSGSLTTFRNYEYTYSDTDGALTALRVPSGRYAYSYDALKRLTSRAQNTLAGAEVSTSTYTYAPGSGTNATSTLVSGLSVKHGTTTVYTAGYTYDDVGNITAITGTAPRSYEYDAQGQLTSETRGGVVYSYTYNAAGNLLSKTKSDNSGTDSFTYGNSDWRDLLTKFNGHTITYDQSGNPLTWHDGTVFTWANGRRLASAVNSTTGLNAAYTYDTDGLRLSKTVGGVQHKYVWFGGKLRSESYPDGNATVKLEFGYDENGRPATFNYNDTWYYYVTNLQGDVVRILAADGTVMARYAYNAWGELTTCTGTLANVNPLRYRGYYYDVETKRYYLKSRYYDPEVCRFLNADSYSSTGQGFIGTNMFAYCLNSPINRADYSGYSGLLLVILAVVGCTVALSGCSSKEASRSSSSASSVASPSPHTAPSPHRPLSYEQKVLISTIAAEGSVTIQGIPVSSKARQAMANVALNRVGKREWSEYTTVSDICQYSGFDGYGSNNYYSCMKYLDGRDGSNAVYEAIISDVLRAYESDITDGCQLYYTPAAMSPAGSSPEWDFSSLIEVPIPGIDPYYEGRFYKYG